MTDAIKYALPLLLLPVTAAAGGGGNVLPLGSHAFGTTYEELAQDWLPWALQGPADSNPMFDETGDNCAMGQSGKVWFLAGTMGDGAVERECTVPLGKALFFPVINAFWVGFATDTETEEEIHEILDTYYFSQTNDLWVTVDGDEVDDVWDYFVEGSAYSLTLDDDRVWPSIDDAGPSPYYPTVVDGWFMLLTPMSKGDHVIEFGGTMDDGSTIAATYSLTFE